MEREMIVKKISDEKGNVTGYQLQGQLIRCLDCKYNRYNFEGVPECTFWKTTTYSYQGYCSWAKEKDNQ